MPSIPASSARRQPHAQGFARCVHGELFHAVDEDQPVAALGFHGSPHMAARGFFQRGQAKLHRGFVAAGDVGLVLLELGADEFGVKPGVGHGLHHGVGDMADAAEARHFQRKFGTRYIHTHAADDDRNQLLFAEAQAKIINTFHSDPLFFVGSHVRSGGRRQHALYGFWPTE